MNLDAFIGWWFVGWAAVLPVSIAAASLLYFPLVGLYVLLGAWSFRRWPPQWGPSEKAFAVFFALSALSAACGLDPRHSWVRLGKDLYFLILVLVCAYLAREGSASRLLKVFMVSAVLTAAFGVLQRVIGVNQSDHAGGYFFFLPHWLAHAPRSLQDHLSMVNGRAVGTRPHPLTYAEGLLLPLGYALSVIASGRAGWKKWAIANYLVILGLLVSQSRGCWIAAFVMAFIVGALKRETRVYRRLALLYLPLALCFLSPVLRARALSITDASYAPNAERLEMWRAGVQMVKDHPLLGVGTGSMHLASTAYQSDERKKEGPWGHLHDMYINLAAERGLPTLMALLIFFMTLAYEMGKGYRMALETHADETEMILTGLLCLAGWLVAGLTETINNDSTVLMTFYFVFGFSLAASRHLLKKLKRV